MLIVHRASSGAALARGLADVLAVPGADPFAAEVVAVPAKGVERWLAQRLSHVLGTDSGDGVCANVAFPWPSALVDETLQATSTAHAEAVERWAPARAVWPLLDVIDASVPGEPWCRSLAQHLGTDAEDKGRRLAVARRLAGMYDEYGQSRPAMLRAWAAGRDERGDGTPLDADLHWQAELWRRLRDALATPSPAELLDDACQQLRDQPQLSTLPDRVSVFGASRLSPARLQVLAALAAHRDVHLWLHHSSPALWDTVAGTTPSLRRADDETRTALRNPLLTSLSRDVLELQQLVARTAPGSATVLHPSPPAPATLLGRLQQDLADDHVPAEPPPLVDGDRSVQVHACHGRTRQVEVLREVIVGLLADDPTLEPRDVLVMCPDVETFAPIIAATFAIGAEDDAAHPAARLRVRLADRALRQTNALLAVLSQLLELGSARLTASQLLDLAGTPAVRQRFGFDDDALERLRDWTVGAGVRWGLDGEHRAAWALGDVTQGTWRDGLDRLLLGAAMEGALDSWGDVVPLDDVDSSDIDLAGRLAELVDRVAAAQALMAGRHTASAWMTGLEDAVGGLAATTYDTAWQLLQLRGELGDIAESADGSTALLGLADVRALLASSLAGRPTRASFRTGTLTVCTLVPMRSVPHRVVCLLGLDDGVFPRQSNRDGDDVLARDPWVGERDPRSEDRQLFLDALSAAEDHLVITYTGADERTGAPVPPAVPLGELLDALDRTATVAGVPDGRVRDAVTTHHALQPFDPRNFAPGPAGRSFSFDPLSYAGARAAAGERTEPLPMYSSALPLAAAGGRRPRRPAADAHATRHAVSCGSGCRSPRPAARTSPTMRCRSSWTPWSSGLSASGCCTSGWPASSPPTASPSSSTAAPCRPDRSASPSCLRSGRRSRGCCRPPPWSARCRRSRTTSTCRCPTAPGWPAPSVAYAATPCSRSPTPASARGTGCSPGSTWSRSPSRSRTGEWRAAAIGRGRGNRAQRSTFDPLDQTEARVALDELVALHRAGLRSPLPLPVKTAAAYAGRRNTGDTPTARQGAEREWLTDRFPGEQEDVEHVLLHGPRAPLTVLTTQRPEPGEGGAGWHADETDRFGLLARRLWGRLLDAETSVQT